MVDPPTGGPVEANVYFVYALISTTTGRIYIGQTENLIERLKWHNKIKVSKKTGYTYINKGPWKIIHTESFLTRKEAKIRERQLKSARGREFIKKKIIK